MSFEDELALMHADCLDQLGDTGTLIRPAGGQIDPNTGVRAVGADESQDIRMSVTPAVRAGRALTIRVWCLRDDVTIGGGNEPEIGWKFTAADRTWTITAVEPDASGAGLWLTGQVSAE